MIRVVVVNPKSADKLALATVDDPKPLQNEALVRVHAFSLNRGEVRRVMNATETVRPGWDIAGVIQQAAADGTGPQAGQRVVGLLASGAWAEVVAVPTNAIAALPDDVTFQAAATLPVAGLTALYSIERASGLLGRRVLVTGASGGVGLYACQLARLSGARVCGLVRQAVHADVVKQAGAEQVIVSDDASDAGQFGRYRLVVESVGGKVLAAALGMLDRGGVCVSFGATQNHEVTFNLLSLVGTGRASLYGFGLFNEIKYEPAAAGLERLVYLLASNKIKPFIAFEAPWQHIADVARQLYDRRFTGKAVLLVD